MFFFAFETLRLWGLATEQAKRNTPIVDDDRPVSRAYRTYLDNEAADPYDEPPRRRDRYDDDDDGYDY